MFLIPNLFQTARINQKPPTIYSILNSICNFDKEEITKTKDLAKIGRTKIFDFDYPLINESKENFETMILNHFIMRRIGFETPTMFKLQLNVKLNEIMPTYNKMFSMLEGWDIFHDGEEITRTTNTNNVNDYEGHKINTGTNTNTNTGTNITENTGENTSNTSVDTYMDSSTDNRISDLPQSDLSNVQNADYMTNYTLTKNEENGNDSTVTTENINTTNKNTIDTTNKNLIDLTEVAYNTTKNIGDITEKINRSPADKLKIYNEFIEKRTNIYTMIFKDLESLFYQLI